MWLLSLNRLIWGYFNYVPVCINRPFLLLNSISLFGYITTGLFIQQFLDFEWFTILATTKKSIYKINAFFSLEWTNRSGMVGSYGRCTFKFLRNYQTVFQNGFTILHSPHDKTVIIGTIWFFRFIKELVLWDSSKRNP